jgi:2-polyprenyl-6-methoxyphenol hydroxylase-like FAD-dependent oxidoreductase
MMLFNSGGKTILEVDGFPILFSNRGYAQNALYDYAVEIGVKFRFNARVTSYFEEDDCAGVYVGDERVQADGVIAADGIHSKARKYVTAKQEHPRTSGFAVYRAWFPLAVLGQDERTRHFTDLKEDLFHVWLGTDVHAILVINVALKGVTVFCTHKVRAFPRLRSL